MRTTPPLHLALKGTGLVKFEAILALGATITRLAFDTTTVTIVASSRNATRFRLGNQGIRHSRVAHLFSRSRENNVLLLSCCRSIFLRVLRRAVDNPFVSGSVEDMIDARCRWRLVSLDVVGIESLPLKSGVGSRRSSGYVPRPNPTTSWLKDFT